MPCLRSIALCGQLETSYWEAAAAIRPENNEWCRSRNNGERIRAASQRCLAACKHAWNKHRTRRRIATSPTNLWVGFESSCTRGQYGLTSARNLSQGKGHQCIGCCSSWKVNVAGFYVHAVSRCNRGSQPSKFLLFLSTNFYPESQTASPMHVRYDLLAGKMAH